MSFSVHAFRCSAVCSQRTFRYSDAPASHLMYPDLIPSRIPTVCDPQMISSYSFCRSFSSCSSTLLLLFQIFDGFLPYLDPVSGFLTLHLMVHNLQTVDLIRAHLLLIGFFCILLILSPFFSFYSRRETVAPAGGAFPAIPCHSGEGSGYRQAARRVPLHPLHRLMQR